MEKRKIIRKQVNRLIKFKVKNEEVFSDKKTTIEKIIQMLQKYERINIELINQKPCNYIINDKSKGKYLYIIVVSNEENVIKKIKCRWFVIDIAAWILNYKRLATGEKLIFTVVKIDTEEESFEQLMQHSSYKKVNGIIKQKY